LRGNKTVGTLKELEELIEGDVLYDELSRAMYSSGACLYRVRPLGIVRPKHKRDVIELVRFAAKSGISITARGGGTSRVGNELGEGIILDFSKYMNKISDFDKEGNWVEVQPGLILSSLNKFLKPHNLFFPIDPSTKDYCTLGGMIANNSSGPHAVKYGTTRNYVLSLEVVLSNGEVMTTCPVSLVEKDFEVDKHPKNLEGKIYKTMPEILERYSEPWKDEKPFTTKNSSGYDLWGLQGHTPTLTLPREGGGDFKENAFSTAPNRSPARRDSASGTRGVGDFGEDSFSPAPDRSSDRRDYASGRRGLGDFSENSYSPSPGGLRLVEPTPRPPAHRGLRPGGRGGGLGGGGENRVAGTPTRRDVSGQDGGFLDLTSLFVGSEGTLGIVTEAKLKLVPIPTGALSGLVYFDNLAHVGTATQKILELSPSMIEIMERQILDLARKHKKEMKPYLPEGIEALLFIEFQDDNDENLRQKFKEVENRLVREDSLAVDLKVARDDKDMAMFEKVRSISGPILNQVRGPEKPIAFIEDTAVHPSRLPQYIAGLRGLFKKFGVEASIYGHAGDGNLHNMVFMDLSREDGVEKMTTLTEAVYDLVLDLKGTLSAEHGDGRLRTHYLKKQFPTLYPAFVEIKGLFDPQGILNPGCVVGGEQNPLIQDLKYGVEYHIAPTGSVFDEQPLRTEVESCSGCGKCRSYCPIAQSVPEERALGRAKATLLREVISGHLDSNYLESQEFKELMDTCINCKRCLKECPSTADIPWLALSGRATYSDKHGEPISNRFLTGTDFLCKSGSALAPLMNLANSMAPVRSLLEKAVGLDRRRRLPEFRRRTLRKLVKDRPRPQGDKKVVYFLSCYSNYVEPEGDGLATVEVLQHNGFDVLIPEFKCCGIARISSGSASRVMKDIQKNHEMITHYVQQGLDIVFSEPSCALAVKMEYPKILPAQEIQQNGNRCYDIHQYLMMLYKKGELKLNFGQMDLSVGYHNPCHLRALGVVKEPVELLRLIPGVRVKEFSDECCGLAGTYGMKRKYFDLSMEIGSRLFDEINDSQTDEIASGCGACSLQILQGSGRQAVHPISLLSMAYKKGSKGQSWLGP
jgi:anaerobic glycerol-3-phosphate dehydrogenase C subunit